MNSLWIEGEGGGEVCPGGDGAKGGARDWRMAEVKNGREKEMWCRVGRAASSSVSSLIHLPASAPPLQGSFSSSSLSLPLLHMFFPLLFVLILFYVSLSMENTAPFADLVSQQCCPSRVKIRLFFQMFSGILFALWLLSLIIFFYRQFSSCSCSDFASQALHFFDPSFFFVFWRVFFDSSCCVCWFPSCSSSSRCLPFISQASPLASSSAPKTDDDSWGNGEFESVCPTSSSQRQGSIKTAFSIDAGAARRTSKPSRIYIIAKTGRREKQPFSDADIRAGTSVNDKRKNVKQHWTQLKQIPLRWWLCVYVSVRNLNKDNKINWSKVLRQTFRINQSIKHVGSLVVAHLGLTSQSIK